MDGAAAEVLLRHLVRGAGGVRRRLRRLDAEGPGHVLHQRDQGRGLRDDAVLRRAHAARRPEFLTILVAYAVVGFGAAAYSPAKYGILTELLPPQQLVAANGWIEGLTVGSIILGTLVGGALVSDTVSRALLGFDIPRIDTGIDTPGEAAIAIILFGT